MVSRCIGRPSPADELLELLAERAAAGDVAAAAGR